MKRIFVLGIISLWIQGYPVYASDIFEKNHLSPSSFIDENNSGDIPYGSFTDQMQSFLDMNNHDQLSSKLSLMMTERLDETSADASLGNFEQDLRQDLHDDFVSGNIDMDYSLSVPETETSFVENNAIPPPEEFRDGASAIPPPEEQYQDAPLLWINFNVDEKDGGMTGLVDQHGYAGIEWFGDNSTPLFINENEPVTYPDQIILPQNQPIFIWDMDQQIYMDFPMQSAILPAVKGNQFELEKDAVNGGKAYSIQASCIVRDEFNPLENSRGYLSLANMISMNKVRSEGWTAVLQGNTTPFLYFGKENAARQLPFNYFVSTKSVSHFTRLHNPVYGLDDDAHLLKDAVENSEQVSEPSNYILDSHSEGDQVRNMMEYELYHLEYMADIFAKNKKTSWNQEFTSLLRMYFEKAGEWKYFVEGFDFKRALRDELINRYKFARIPDISGKDISNVLKILFKIQYGQDKIFSKYMTIDKLLSLKVSEDKYNGLWIDPFKNKMIELLNDLSFYEAHQEVITLSEKGEAKEALDELLNKQIFIAGEAGVKLKSALTSEEKTAVRKFNLTVMEELYPDTLRVKYKNSMDTKDLNQLFKSLGLALYSGEILDSVKEKFFDMSISPSMTHGNFLEKTYLLMSRDFKLTALQINDLLNDPEFLEMWNQKLCFLRSLKWMDPSPESEKSS